MAGGTKALDLSMQLGGYALNAGLSLTDIGRKAFAQLVDRISEIISNLLKKGRCDAIVMPSYFMANELKGILKDNGINAEIIAENGRGVLYIDKKDSLKANLLVERFYMDLERGSAVSIELLRNYADNNIMQITLPSVEGYMLTEKMLDAGIPHTTLIPNDGETTVQFAFKDLDSVNFLRGSEIAFLMDKVNRDAYLKQYDHKCNFSAKIKDMAMGKIKDIPEGLVLTNGHGCTVQFKSGGFSVTEKLRPKTIAFDDDNAKQNIDAIITSWAGDEAIKNLLKEATSKKGNLEKLKDEEGKTYKDSFGREIEFIEGGIIFTQIGEYKDCAYESGNIENVAENLTAMLFEDADNLTGEPVVMTKEQFDNFQEMTTTDRVKFMFDLQHHLGDNPLFTDVGNRPELTETEKEHAMNVKDIRETLNYPADDRTEELMRQMTIRNFVRTLGLPRQEMTKQLTLVDINEEQISNLKEELRDHNFDPVSLDDVSKQILESIINDDERCREFFEDLEVNKGLFRREQEREVGVSVMDPQERDKFDRYM